MPAPSGRQHTHRTPAKVGTLVIAKILRVVQGVLYDTGDRAVVDGGANEYSIGPTQLLYKITRTFRSPPRQAVIEGQIQGGASNQTGLTASLRCMLQKQLQPTSKRD